MLRFCSLWDWAAAARGPREPTEGEAPRVSSFHRQTHVLSPGAPTRGCCSHTVCPFSHCGSLAKKQTLALPVVVVSVVTRGQEVSLPAGVSVLAWGSSSPAGESKRCSWD